MVDKLSQPCRASKARQASEPGYFSDDQVKAFISAGQLKSIDDVQSALKELFGKTLQAMLEGEMDHHLGYTKHQKSKVVLFVKTV
jgi:hypothetical protein